ncbi:hypothetical protein [Actinomadura logoneensis]|uniref:hypothetical protein n=1 Tax=Actinomadura logoneensis TaxID=2293572 RepID=UPI0011C151D8|nr:hypothetical protein [Actinomadura logoneensis]
MSSEKPSFDSLDVPPETSRRQDAAQRARDPFTTLWADEPEPEPEPGSFFATTSPPPEQTSFWEADLPSLPRTAPSIRRRSRGLVLTVVGAVAATAGGTLAWALVSQDSRPSPAPQAPPPSTAPADQPSAVAPPPPDAVPPTAPVPPTGAAPSKGVASPTERPSAQASPTHSGAHAPHAPSAPARGGGGTAPSSHHQNPPPRRHVPPPRVTHPKPQPKPRTHPGPKLCPVYDNGVLVAYRPC